MSIRFPSPTNSWATHRLSSAGPVLEGQFRGGGNENRQPWPFLPDRSHKRRNPYHRVIANMSERFFLPADLNASELRLMGAEAHHLARVRRLGPGDRVILFDGAGAEVEATIEAVSKREVRLRPGPVRRPPAPTAIPITLAVAPPKGDRFRWLVEKATELGVARLVPILTARTVVEPGAGKLEKLRQTIIAACKQSGRCELMELAAPVSLGEYLEQLERTASSRVVLMRPEQPPLSNVLMEASQGSLLLLVGPEGGFTEGEIALARDAGAKGASLGRTVLRTETAAVSAAAVAVQTVMIE